jgi:hypothetical protein
MEIDRELVEGCLSDMKFAHKYLVDISKLGVPVFLQASMLSLRILDLETELRDNKTDDVCSSN